MPQRTLVVPPVRRRRYLRAQRLRQLGYRSYGHYLQSSHWRATKARYRAAEHLPQACMCEAVDNLQLHHMTYERLGEELLTDLVPLCVTCHNMVHELERRGDITLDFQGMLDEVRAQRGRELLEEHHDRRAQEQVRFNAERRTKLDALPLARRIALVKHTAGLKHIDVQRRMWMIECLYRQGRSEQTVIKKLSSLEVIVYGM